MKTMKRVYKTHDMVVWENEKNKNSSCHIFSIGEDNWFAGTIIDNLDTTIGEYNSKTQAFKMLQSHMEKIGYTIKI